MITLQGNGVSQGLARGPIKFYKHGSVRPERNEVADRAAEAARYRAASQQAEDQLAALAAKAAEEAGQDAADLFNTHILMLEDLDYVDAITSIIENDGLNAEYAVSETGKQFAGIFASMDDEYMRARSADVLDISNRLVRILSGGENTDDAPAVPSLIAADDLSPGETVQLDKKMILGFILRKGSANSHTAILARMLGIPAVISLGGGLGEEYNGSYAVMDGGSGTVIIEPDAATVADFTEKLRLQNDKRARLRSLIGLEDVTTDGKKIQLYANIASPDDVDAVLDNDAAGIGLFRSEFLYLHSEDYPTEEEQFAAYRSVLQRMGNREVVIRTLDIGADKQISYFDLPHEENPALGLRAMRICLTRPEVFRTQLRALYRASAFGRLSIMLPMIASVWEVQEARKICEEVKSQLRAENTSFDDKVALGIMIETPAAAVTADLLAKEADFFSIGTNDLTQYTLAADRQGSEQMRRFSDPYHPAVMRLIKMTADGAHAAGIRVGICGEIGADTKCTREFLKMGIDELSVSPKSVLPVREIIRSSTAQE